MLIQFPVSPIERRERLDRARLRREGYPHPTARDLISSAQPLPPRPEAAEAMLAAGLGIHRQALATCPRCGRRHRRPKAEARCRAAHR